jgi:hypothetical protein
VDSFSVSQTASRVIEANWSEKDGDDLAQSLGTVFTLVRDENQWRTDKDEYHWGLYEGSGMGGVTVRSRKNMTYANATLPDNVCKMAVDTLTAKVATIRPIPQVLGSQMNWKDHRRARKMRQLIDGEFYNQRVHEELSSRIIKDAQVARGGAVQVYVDGKKPKVERVHIWTLYVDDWDAEFGEPLTLMRLRTMDRAKAIRKFGKKHRDALEKAGRFTTNTQLALDEDRSATVDRVELVEAWHRCPDHDDDDDDHECNGRHVIICEGHVLFDEPWPHTFFPFAILTYDTPNTGYWGSGVVQMLEGYQVAINDTNARVDEGYHYSGKGVIIKDGSGIYKTDIVNGMRVYQCKPGPYEPTVFDMDLVNEHMRMRPMELVERALNASGVSQMAAQSKKPAGVDAAIALQTLDDIESQRHIVFGRRFEAWCMNVARLLIECIKKIAKEHGDYAVKVPLAGHYLDLKWKDVEVDGFQLQMQTVGQLYLNFTGRLEKLTKLFELGAIDKATFMRHLDAGDVQSEIDLETIDRLNVDEMIEAMLDAEQPANDNGGPDRNYKAPDEYLPLQWAHKRAHQRRLQAENNGAPIYVLGLLGRFIDDCKYLMDKAAAAVAPPPPAAAPMAGAPPPSGGPMPPPDGGGLPMMPEALTPAGDALMQSPSGDVAPPMAA